MTHIFLNNIKTQNQVNFIKTEILRALKNPSLPLLL